MIQRPVHGKHQECGELNNCRPLSITGVGVSSTDSFASDKDDPQIPVHVTDLMNQLSRQHETIRTISFTVDDLRHNTNGAIAP